MQNSPQFDFTLTGWLSHFELRIARHHASRVDLTLITGIRGKVSRISRDPGVRLSGKSRSSVLANHFLDFANDPENDGAFAQFAWYRFTVRKSSQKFA